jgi:hypothetical protein
MLSSSSPPSSTAASAVTRNRRFHKNNTNDSSHPGRVSTVLRQQWSIILLFGMAISLAFYTILTAPTVEQELIARRRRGTDRRYRQQEYGSGSDSGGQRQEIYQQEEVTIATPAMTAPGIATTVAAADWQSVDGRPVLRIIPHSALADSPIVLFSPLPPHMATGNIPPNDNSLTNIAMDNVTDSNSFASHITTAPLSLTEADDESTSRFRQGARTLTTTDTASSAQNSNSHSSSHHRVSPIYYYAALLSAVLGGALTAKRSLDRWITWEADRQEDGLAYDIAYTTTTNEIGYGYGSFVYSEWSGDAFDKFDL